MTFVGPGGFAFMAPFPNNKQKKSILSDCVVSQAGLSSYFSSDFKRENIYGSVNVVVAPGTVPPAPDGDVSPPARHKAKNPTSEAKITTMMSLQGRSSGSYKDLQLEFGPTWRSISKEAASEQRGDQAGICDKWGRESPRLRK